MGKKAMPLIYLVTYWIHKDDPTKTDRLGDVIVPVTMPYYITVDPQKAVDNAIALYFRKRREDPSAHSVIVLRGELDVPHERMFTTKAEEYLVFIIRKFGRGYVARIRDKDFDKLVTWIIPQKYIDAIKKKPA